MNSLWAEFYKLPGIRGRSGVLGTDRVPGATIGGLSYKPGQDHLDHSDVEPLVDHLRHERYINQNVPVNRRSWDLLGKIYYWLRPALPVYVRKYLQRVRLRDWKNLTFPRWPVDRTVETLLARALACYMREADLARVPFIWFWPDGAAACAVMTHDVEEQEGRVFCSKLMDMDDAVRIKSSFQLIPESRYVIPQTFLEELKTRGFEVNIHDLNHDGRLFSEKEEFLRRVIRINAYGKHFGALGFRSGALYRNQEWFGSLEFTYDMSVPSIGHLDPQRGGCCSIMPFFIGKLLELPVTTVQDYSLFHILNDYSIDLWKQQLALIVQHHGVASFIVHPDYVIEKQARSLYAALLEHLAALRDNENLWIALPREVNDWWRARNEMSLVSDPVHGWRIEGKGSERACMAYAELVDGELVFEVESSPSLSKSSL